MRLKLMRRLSQAVVFLGSASVAELNFRGFYHISGGFFQFDFFGLPLGDPLAAAQVLVSAKSVGQSSVIGALLALALAVCLGPVFCSWGCPYGLLSELGQALRDRLKPGRKPNTAKRGIYLKLGLTTAGLVLIGVFGLPPLLNLLSLPGWFSRLSQDWDPLISAISGLVLSSLLALELLAGRRLWCRFVCPQSALISLARRLNPKSLRVGFKARQCSCPSNDRPCGQACSLGLDPRRLDRIPLECNNCGDCTAACAQRGGALGYAFGTPQALDAVLPQKQA